MKHRLAVAALLFGTVGASQAAIPADIVFSGYCDGMHFESAGGGYISGASTGCVTDPLYGVNALRVARQGPAFIITAYASYTGRLFIIRDDGTFSVYLSDGTGEPVNSGTWATAVEGAPQGGRAAGAR